ncbi:aminopeptidase N [Alteromonas facilis]|uniref:aminopeptidase N n=1 Tax=Alteromonas facilis TaxID=2048004 RepID=UPI000C283785|nr:aminopeptidase N [Alteromonas facilis]
MKVAKRLCDYLPPAFSVKTLTLDIVLDEVTTRVIATSTVQRENDNALDLKLDGENLALLSLSINGEMWSDYDVSETALVIHNVPQQFSLRIETTINPSQNTSLEGLYLSNGAFCTQCEAEGFRKITYFMDRPDVLAVYDVTITGDIKKYPQLLSNGNKVGSGVNNDGSHWVRWHDPFPKPCYLFALVAGDLECIRDTYTTSGGKEVSIELYVDKGMGARGSHAIESLKRAMKWDEETFNLEYDLDVYMVVAVDFFNMGAMENKGLNVFNSKFVLANEETATDDDYFNIESVIAHEYFHNWTGNRVTCRDWFQLSLKEGLTVFRDQYFSETYNAALATRIKQVNVIREHQFAEDASPMSHPIRPQEVIEMNNFYTVTVYDKGAEVIRMLWTLLGEQGFKKGMKLYFKRHDGQAVTCDDFVNAMQDANEVDLSLFKRWYAQSGTPRVSMSQTDNGLVVFKQQTPPTADQADKQPLLIPLAIEVIGKEAGKHQGEQIIWLNEESLTTDIRLEDCSAIVVNSHFRAPVAVDYRYSLDELTTILQSASTDFDRWEASQKLFKRSVNDYAAGNTEQLTQTAKLFASFIENNTNNIELLSEVIALPSIESVIAELESVDLNRLLPAYRAVIEAIAKSSSAVLDVLITQLTPRPEYAYTEEQIIQRKCLNSVMRLCAYCNMDLSRIQSVYDCADNMTDTLTALQCAQAADASLFERLMQHFEERWCDDPLVLDKWFALHATTERKDILARIQLLMEHKQFSVKNPNRIRSILGSFAFYNTAGLHNADGSGYKFLVDHLLSIDAVNPQVAARIVTPLISWRKFDESRQTLIQRNLIRILDNPNVSADLYEKVSKSLSQ